MEKYIPRLRTVYKEEIVPMLKEKFEYNSIMQVPKILKVCLNQGVGGATQDKKLVTNAVEELSNIAGQKSGNDLCQKISF